MQMRDLFEPPKSKKDQLLDFIQARHYAPTHEVIRWGLDNLHIRADRDCRDLAQEGKIRRMTEEEKLTSRWARSKEDVWVYCG